MRLGKYGLSALAKDKFAIPYNGDCLAFLSKNRRTLKMIRYDNYKIILYDISYERGYMFLKLVYNDGELWHQLDFKYLAALLNCPVRNELSI